MKLNHLVFFLVVGFSSQHLSLRIIINYYIWPITKSQVIAFIQFCAPVPSHCFYFSCTIFCKILFLYSSNLYQRNCEWMPVAFHLGRARVVIHLSTGGQHCTYRKCNRWKKEELYRKTFSPDFLTFRHFSKWLKKTSAKLSFLWGHFKRGYFKRL